MMREYCKTAVIFFDRRFLFIGGAYAAFVVAVTAIAAVFAGKGVLAFIDHSFLAYAEAMQSEALTSVMSAITALGSGAVVTGLSIIGIVWFLHRNEAMFALALFASVGGAACVAAVMKRILERPRPSGFLAFQEHTFSFPSGHAALSLAFFGILVYFLLRHTQQLSLKICAVMAGIVAVGAIGVSRIYLGAHWPSDVLGSYVLVGAWLFIVIRQTERKIAEQLLK